MPIKKCLVIQPHAIGVITPCCDDDDDDDDDDE